MKHPNQATLALHAGGDLGPLARWRTERHLAQCERCRTEVAGFENLRQILPDLSETPEIPWNRLAAEMKANIRLGLAAGECVRDDQRRPVREMRLFTGIRAAAAVAGIAALLFTGIVLQHPSPVPVDPVAQASSTSSGIEVSNGGRTFRLLNVKAERVIYSAGAQGSMRARYVDPDTGYVTINRVDVE
jgi:anti-sigma factor RsiW